MFTYTRHATKLSDWLLKSYDIFSIRKGQKKLNLIQLSSERNGTENFPVHMTHAHAHELFCSVPVRGKFSVSGNPPLKWCNTLSSLLDLRMLSPHCLCLLDAKVSNSIGHRRWSSRVYKFRTECCILLTTLSRAAPSKVEQGRV